ncbi:MAG: polysaccharide deacetylase family protein [Cyanobacteria bacterium P01_G01_bin.54]
MQLTYQFLMISKNRKQHPKWHKHRLTIFVTLLIFTLGCVVLTGYLTAIRLPIFGFHDIYHPEHPGYVSDAPYLDYSSIKLEKVLNQLVTENYWFLSSPEIEQYFIEKTTQLPPSRQRSRPVAISFDDSYKSVKTEVLPIVERIYHEHGIKIPLILFLNSERMSKPSDEKYLTCDDIKEGMLAGFYDVQSAGKDHRKLTKYSSSIVEADIAHSQTWLRQCLGNRGNATPIAQHFAYPYNNLNRRVINIVSQFHLTAFRYHNRLQRMGWTTRRYAISRLGVNQNTPPSYLLKQAHLASQL